MESAPRSLAARLSAARNKTFVGRSHELGKFRATLSGKPGFPAMFYVHGPGGVGKSALLRQLAHEAMEAGRLVVEVDGRHIDPSPMGLESGPTAARRPANSWLSWPGCA